MKNNVLAYIGLGSNLQNPLKQIKNALSFLDSLPDSKIEKISSYYATSPVGVEDHPDYINAVAALNTTLSAEELLEECLSFEDAVGRQRVEGVVTPRPIDLDILLYGNETIQTDSLLVPHPRMLQRGFVLLPLQEIAPELVIPTGEVLQLVVEHWRKSATDEVRRLDNGC